MDNPEQINPFYEKYKEQIDEEIERDNIIKQEIDLEKWEQEQQYRRGVSHGFSLALKEKNRREKEDLMERIEEWKRDPLNFFCTPGSNYEDVTNKWYFKDQEEKE